MIRNLPLLALALLAVSCAGSNSQPTEARALPRVGDPAVAPAPARPRIENPAFPKGAMYSIHCATYTGMDHIAQSKAMKDALASVLPNDPRTKHLREWYIIHGDDQSSLNYGYYGDVDNDQRELNRMHADQKSIGGLINTQNGERLFPIAQRVALDSGGEVEGPPEWNLANAKGTWSLEVMAFVTGNRKRNAVEYCTEARKAGYEAYYYHGATISSVCIKSWPEKSIRIHQADRVEDPSAAVLVMAPGMEELDPNRPVRTPDGRPVEVIQTRVQILDPDVLATMKECPFHGIDGVVHERKRAGAAKGVKDGSFIVRIPKSAGPGVGPAMPGQRAVPGERGRPPVDSRRLPSMGGN